MPTLAPRLASLAPKLPVRIDLTWLKDHRERADEVQQHVESPAQIHESAERSRLVSQIIELTPTASPQFLSSFGSGELTAYLSHLNVAHEQRGRQSRWVRPDNTPGISVRTARV